MIAVTDALSQDAERILKGNPSRCRNDSFSVDAEGAESVSLLGWQSRIPSDFFDGAHPSPVTAKTIQTFLAIASGAVNPPAN